MDNNSALILGIALMIIMWGMGLSLVPADFARVLKYPKATLVGLANQLILLPLIAFALATVFPVSADIAIGLMILAACPGGATSNLISHLAKGDTALSITLTAITSLITIITIPFIINFSLVTFMNEGQVVQLDVMDTIKKILMIVIIPVVVGMVIRRFFAGFAEKMGKPVRIASAVILGVIILGVVIKEKEHLADYFAQAGMITLVLNLITMFIGFYSSKLFHLTKPQSVTISIESGIQNGTMAIAIAVGLLNNSAYSISAAIYSLIMFFTAGIIIYYGVKRMKDVVH